jgi:hypothetical protein
VLPFLAGIGTLSTFLIEYLSTHYHCSLMMNDDLLMTADQNQTRELKQKKYERNEIFKIGKVGVNPSCIVGCFL